METATVEVSKRDMMKLFAAFMAAPVVKYIPAVTPLFSADDIYAENILVGVIDKERIVVNEVVSAKLLWPATNVTEMRDLVSKQFPGMDVWVMELKR